MKSLFGSKMLRTVLSGTALAMMLTLGVDASAALITYTSQSAFALAIAGMSATTTDFETTAAGTTYAAGSGPGGSGFTLQLTGPSAATQLPAVSDQFWTTSGTHYLGLDNPDSALEAGDVLTFTFASGVRAFGLFVIGTHDIDGGDITLSSGATTVANAATASLSDGAGSFAFFLGLVSDDASTFGSVSLHDLAALDTRLLNIAIDDVTLARDGATPVPVPEPGTLLLVLVGMMVIRTMMRRAG